MANPWELQYEGAAPLPWEATYSDEKAKKDRTFYEVLHENLIGSGAVDTVGERIGETIRAGGAGMMQGVQGLASLPELVYGLGKRGFQVATGDMPDPMSGDTVGGKAVSDAYAGWADLIGADPKGMDYVSPFKAGKYAGEIGKFYGGGAGGKIALMAGGASEALGQATEGSMLEPYARVAGGLLGPSVVGGLSRAISPLGGRINATQKDLIKVLEDSGVSLTAGQKTSSGVLRGAETGSFGGAKALAKQDEDFTKAVLATAGIKSSTASPEVIGKAFKDLGKVYDNSVKGVIIAPDANIIKRSAQAVDDYKSLSGTATRLPLVNDIHATLTKAFRSEAAIPAETIRNWRSKFRTLRKSPDDAVRASAEQMENLMDDMLENALMLAAKPKELAALKDARRKFANLYPIAVATTRAGNRGDIITPESLMSALKGQNKMQVAKGQRGDLGLLARAGTEMMPALPTVAPNATRNVSNLLPLALGAAGGYSGGVTGALAGAALPALASEATMLPWAQKWLANQIARPQPIISPIPRTIGGLMAQ
tara:strand:- start:66 stop:1682 length:1617 start_codon:yes stop_codon:yes gene_type:complete